MQHVALVSPESYYDNLLVVQWKYNNHKCAVALRGGEILTLSPIIIFKCFLINLKKHSSQACSGHNYENLFCAPQLGNHSCLQYWSICSTFIMYTFRMQQRSRQNFEQHPYRKAPSLRLLFLFEHVPHVWTNITRSHWLLLWNMPNLLSKFLKELHSIPHRIYQGRWPQLLQML